MRIAALVLALSLPFASAHADESSKFNEALLKVEQAAESYSRGSRESRRFGVLLTGIDPYPSLYGVSVALNVTDFFQISGSYGHVPADLIKIVRTSYSVDTYALNARAFVPGWKFSPFVGIGRSWARATPVARAMGYGMSSFDDPEALGTDFIEQNVEGKAAAWLVNAGFSWQARSGFAVNLGVNIPFGMVQAEADSVFGTLGSHEADASEQYPLPYLSLGWFF